MWTKASLRKEGHCSVTFTTMFLRDLTVVIPLISVCKGKDFVINKLTADFFLFWGTEMHEDLFVIYFFLFLFLSLFFANVFILFISIQLREPPSLWNRNQRTLRQDLFTLKETVKMSVRAVSTLSAHWLDAPQMLGLPTALRPCVEKYCLVKEPQWM